MYTYVLETRETDAATESWRILDVFGSWRNAMNSGARRAERRVELETDIDEAERQGMMPRRPAVADGSGEILTVSGDGTGYRVTTWCLVRGIG